MESQKIVPIFLSRSSIVTAMNMAYNSQQDLYRFHWIGKTNWVLAEALGLPSLQLDSHLQITFNKFVPSKCPIESNRHLFCCILFAFFLFFWWWRRDLKQWELVETHTFNFICFLLYIFKNRMTTSRERNSPNRLMFRHDLKSSGDKSWLYIKMKQISIQDNQPVDWGDLDDK